VLGYLLRLPFGLVTRGGLAIGVLVVSWTLWHLSPQQSVEIIRRPIQEESPQFGPPIRFPDEMTCGSFVDHGSLMNLSDHTWSAERRQDESLSVFEAGSRRQISLIPADSHRSFRWVTGSRVGRRLGAQVNGHYEVWDVTTGKLLHRVVSADRDDSSPHVIPEYRLAPSGRHVFTNTATSAAVIDVDRRAMTVRVVQGQAIRGTADETSDERISEICHSLFSLDGRWLMILLRDQHWKCWLWLWDLRLGQPIWRRATAEFDATIAGWSSFDLSSRYFALSAVPLDTVIDVGTSPPTDISAVLNTSGRNHSLGRGRYINLTPDEHPTECRVWDLDDRRLLSTTALRGSANFMILSPDDHLAIIAEYGSEPGYMAYLYELLKSIGLHSMHPRTSYVVIDVESGHVVNRLAADRILHFDEGIQSVWAMRRNSQTIGTPEVVFERFPLRSAGPPWWLYGFTAAGIGFVAADSALALRRRRKVSLLDLTV
jgi:hypothetical protein